MNCKQCAVEGRLDLTVEVRLLPSILSGELDISGNIKIEGTIPSELSNATELRKSFASLDRQESFRVSHR